MYERKIPLSLDGGVHLCWEAIKGRWKVTIASGIGHLENFGPESTRVNGEIKYIRKVCWQKSSINYEIL